MADFQHLFYINQEAFGGQMQTKRLLCLIVRIQTESYGEHIQDKRFLCLIARSSYTTWHFLPPDTARYLIVCILSHTINRKQLKDHIATGLMCRF